MKKHMNTPEENNKDRNKQPRTPIIDGDARPDIDLNPEEPTNDEAARKNDKGKTTKNRVDTNSLEDFRDAK
jgi:hypothetical protein